MTLLEVDSLKVSSPHERDVSSGSRRSAGGRRCLVRRSSRARRWARRRVGLRKSTLGRAMLRLIEPTAGESSSTATTRACRGERAAQAPAPDADGLPGPLRLAQPADAVAGSPRAAAHPQARRARRDGDPRPGAARRCRPRRCVGATRTSSPAASGSASASRAPSPWSRVIIATNRCRRSTSRSRRRSSTCWASSSGARPDVPVHRSRPRRGPAHRRPGRGDVPRKDRRGRSGGRLYANPLHPYTARLLSAVPVPDPRRRKAPQGHPCRRRSAQPGESAGGVPLPYTLPFRAADPLRGGRAAAPLARRTRRRVPLRRGHQGRSHRTRNSPVRCHRDSPVRAISRSS